MAMGNCPGVMDTGQGAPASAPAGVHRAMVLSALPVNTSPDAPRAMDQGLLPGTAGYDVVVARATAGVMRAAAMRVPAASGVRVLRRGCMGVRGSPSG